MKMVGRRQLLVVCSFAFAAAYIGESTRNRKITKPVLHMSEGPKNSKEAEIAGDVSIMSAVVTGIVHVVDKIIDHGQFVSVSALSDFLFIVTWLATLTAFIKWTPGVLHKLWYKGPDEEAAKKAKELAAKKAKAMNMAEEQTETPNQAEAP